MKHNSVLLIKGVNHHLLQSLELLNIVPTDDYRELVLKLQTKKKHIHLVCDNMNRGSPFLVIFFLIEALGDVADESDRQM